MKMKKMALALFAVLLMTAITPAQNITAGKIGLGIDGVTSPNLAAKYYWTNNLSSEILLGFNLYSPGGDAVAGQTKVTGTDIRVGASLLYNFSDGDFVPYTGVEVLYNTKKVGGFYTTEPDAKNIIDANLVFGGEYFVSKHFSVGIKEKIGFEAQLSRDIPKEENDIYLNTATTVTARYYFN
jgi:outer membrane protein W